MNIISPDPIYCVINRLMDELCAMADAAEGEIAPDIFEKKARAISVLLKTNGDIAGHNEAVIQLEDKEKYLSYEDLPPPPPEERDRIITRLVEQFRNINDTEKIPENS